MRGAQETRALRRRFPRGRARFRRRKMTNRLNSSANRCQLQNLCCKQSSRLAFWAGSERFDFWFTNGNGFFKAHYRAMQQMRTELFPLHHAVEDALRDARCSMASPHALGTASDLLIRVKLAFSMTLPIGSISFVACPMCCGSGRNLIRCTG